MGHPDHSVTNSWINGPNIQIGSVSGSVALALDRPDYQLQWLEPAVRDTWVPRRRRTPSYLLDAREEVVPYRPRAAVQEQLLEWRDEPGVPMSVLLVHGPGGLGKTRLVNAFAGQAYLAGWAVAHAIHRATAPRALLAEPTTPSPAPTPATVDGAEELSCVLVAIDYAERWDADALVRLLTSLPVDFPGRVVRVLLLARSRIDLWSHLEAQLDRAPTELWVPIELKDLTTTAAERLEAFNDATMAFQTRLELDVEELVPPDLSDPDYGSPLILHMSALAAVCAARDHERRPGLNELSSYLLRHEGRFWPGHAPDPDSGITRAQATASVFLATLFGPLSNADSAYALLSHAQVASGLTARAVLAWHDRLYPEGPTVAGRQPTIQQPALTPLRPDRFGEDFIAGYLVEQPRAATMLAQVLTPHPQASVPDPASVRRCLIVLAATADRHEHARQVMWSVLLEQPALASHASDPLIETLIRHAPRHVCMTVMNELHSYRTDLLRPMLHLTQHLLDTLPRHAAKSEQAGLLNNLGIRLAATGERQAALEHTRKAVVLYRQLTAVDRAIYMPDLAMSLTNLGSQMAAAGEKQAALEPSREAVFLYRQLAETDSGEHLPDLAGSLINLGNQLSSAGHKQAALGPAREAVLSYRKLAEEDPAFLSNLALSLTNFGNHLGLAGHKQAALEPASEAVLLYRRLAEADPTAHLPSLGASLHNLGSRLSEAGHTLAALNPTQEAVTIRHKLAEMDPVAHLHDLATSLSNLGNRLAEAGDRQAALEPSRAAVVLHRQLAAVDHAAYLPDLALSLNNLGSRLAEAGERQAALEPAREAVLLYRQLVEADPIAYVPNLAMSLNNLGSRLAEAGERQAALEPAREAVLLYRQLVEADPIAHMPNLAMSLNNLGNHLAGAGEKQAALKPSQEAVALYRQLVEADPAANMPNLAMSLNNLSNHLAGAGEKQAALKPSQEAVALYRQLVEADPSGHLPKLAGSLTNLSNRLAEAGDRQGALEPAREAVDLYRPLAAADPAAHMPNLAGSLNNLGTRLTGAGKHQDALNATQEAVTIRRALAELYPAAYLPDLASSLINLGVHLAATGEKEAALEPAREAVDLYRPLAAADPAAHMPNLALSCLALAQSQINKSEPSSTALSEALLAVNEAIDIYSRLAAKWPQIFNEHLAAAYRTVVTVLDGLDRGDEANAVRQRLGARPAGRSTGPAD